MARTSDDDVQKKERLGELVRRGTDTFGGGIDNATGALIGLAVGGPPGAIAGAAVGAVLGTAIRRLGGEISARLLAPREEARVGYVFALAAQEITERLEQGERPRMDGFFEESDSNRSDAEEVWESVLLKSQREPEERKLPYMAHLMANVAFDGEIGAHMAHQITKAAEDLTYRQLCIMSLGAVREQFGLRATDYRGQGLFSKDVYQVLYECLELYNRGYVNFGGEVAFGPTDVKPGNMQLQGLGVDTYRLMELWTLPRSDVEAAAAPLR